MPPGGEARGGEAAGGEARRGAPTPGRERPREVAAALVAAVPALRDEVEALLARIAALHEAAADVPLRPTHGAPHPTAWLLDGERLGLVDFDRLAPRPSRARRRRLRRPARPTSPTRSRAASAS